ncbi:CotH kinase family protein [Rhodocytophaga aerolata]|uniref:CotH kinase family protein n=1 Tax=Rhodocytophaga aerolata TaxID=455078 RepID=A0ABT8RID9_9BACT|nr:CotH kinase family protein [Rhodocytophaga aerolata]MDO1450565.1 CotH kinase family protein [Rhodocytophaga aerolata]
MKALRSLLLTCICMYAAISCKDPDWDERNISTPDWTEATHSQETAPNYEVVFAQNEVNTLEIRMTSGDWENIRKDMQEKFGADFGAGGGMGGIPPAGFPAFDSTQTFNPPTGGGFPGGNGGGINFGTEDPDYVAVAVSFKGKEWYKVGFRLKGNSSLSSVWREGNYKLPFRLDFDEFEEEYPTIKNQRFYGFNELSFSPGYTDNTLIREKVVADIFRQAGIPAAQTSFYKVYIYFGEGLKYCGVYTLVEVIDDTMVKSQFGEESGNIYKPESTFQSFNQEQFEKKNNKEANDYSDVQAAITALNSTNRTTNPTQWRTDLEASFNVNHFLKWLAVNTSIVNWDAYGAMAHNYYLYNDPGKGLTWIPWDHNMSMTSGRGGIPAAGGGGFPGVGMGGMNQTLSLSLSEVSQQWPLIRYLMDDPVYNAQYKSYVKEFTDNVFNTSNMNELFERNHTLISPYVIGPEETEQKSHSLLSSTASFTSDLATLKQHVTTRIQAVKNYLAE